MAEYRIHTRRCRSVGLTEFGEAAPQFVIVDEAHREHIVYTVGGLDAPLSLKREGLATSYVILPHTNYRGQFNSGSTSTGVAAEGTIYWPGNDRRSYGDIARTAQGVAWAGSVITEYQGESGQQYKRNRYYDPTTGRFTQEDPIGLAGGMNLYGYVGGTPSTSATRLGCALPRITTAVIVLGCTRRDWKVRDFLIRSRGCLVICPHESPNERRCAAAHLIDAAAGVRTSRICRPRPAARGRFTDSAVCTNVG